MSETTHRALRLALASLLATALVSQLLIGRSKGLTVVNFFSYFTVLSNTLAVVLLTMLALRPDRDSGSGFAMLRGAVTVYMSVTGLVYALILAPNLTDVGVPEPWIDWSIHVVGPIAVALDWLIEPPPLRLGVNSIPVWMSLPAGYLIYSLIRGPIVDWYPYPFLDPNQSNGYGGVVVWSLVVLAVIVVFGLFYYWWVNHRTRRLTHA